MKKSKVCGVAGLLFIILALMASRSNVSFAWFSDRDNVKKDSRMGIVDIELGTQSHDTMDNTVYFTINNNSNIDIYLRAGIILELQEISENNDWAIADTSEIDIIKASHGWKASKKTFTDKNRNSYTKWFLEYADAEAYTVLSPETKQLSASFRIAGNPTGYKPIVNIVPEAVQADIDGAALNYLKNPEHVNPQW